MGRKVFLVRPEFDGEEFNLERITKKYVEDVLRKHVEGKGVSIKVGDSIGSLVEVPLGSFNGDIILILIRDYFIRYFNPLIFREDRA